MKKISNFIFILFLSSLFFYSCSKEESSPESAAGTSTGIGGSMARFTVVDHYLYSLTETNLKVFDISDPKVAKLVSDQYLGRGMETVFPFKGHLLLGSQAGMHIFSLDNPAAPTFVSTYSHIVSCDPVVAEGNYAYVTLRTGNRCMRGVNRMEVVDISNMKSPKWVKDYAMTNPFGLGIDNGTLFVCDGKAGLRIMDATDPLNIIQTGIADSIKTLDVIPYNNLLMVIGESGLYQYDYTVRDSLEFLSAIPINR